MSRHTLKIALFVSAFVIQGFLLAPVSTAFADAASARQQINTTVQEIDRRVSEIKSLKSAKKLSRAFEKLEELNSYIEANLGGVFYDKVQEVLREDPDYSPPVVDIELGVEFTAGYWEEKITVFENSLKDLSDALSALPAMRNLDFQDQAWAWFKTIKDSVDSLKSLYENLVTLDLVGLFKDGLDGVNTALDNQQAIYDAELQAINTELFRVQVNKLISQTKKNLELVKNAKSAMLVYRMEIIALEYHLRNIRRYTSSAKQDPVWPLNFNNADYTFDPGPYTQAIDRLLADFLAEEFCWTEFARIYNGIQSQALAEKTQVQANINQSAEPPQNKTAYLNDVDSNWGYFNSYADTRYQVQDTARVSALAEYNGLEATADALRAQRQALVDSFWDIAGFVRQALDTFDEQAEGIVQTNLVDFSGESPYFLGREYDPWFPLNQNSYSAEMPGQAPDLTNWGYSNYGEALLLLSGAYRVMLEAALEAESDKAYQGSGRPVATFAKSPLSLVNRNIVESNLLALDAQADSFATHMDTKRALIPDMEARHWQLLAAEAALVEHARQNWIYLCVDPDALSADSTRTWDEIHISVLLASLDADEGSFQAKAAIGDHLDYLAGQDYANQQIDLSTALIDRMEADADLRAVVAFTVSDYAVLPAMPSEQGFLDFITQLEWIDAFYSLGDLNRVMDLRQEAKEIFQRIYADAGSLNQWIRPENPYCVTPESEEAFNNLVNQIGLWSDNHMEAVRQGFPGWEAWARGQLALHWPAGNTDDVRPNVIHFTPGRNSEMVSLYQEIRVSFNEAMDPDTLVAPHIEFTANGTPRPMKLRYDEAGETLFIDPGRMLPGTVYTLAFGEECTDLAGNSLVPESWSFTTMEMPAEAPAGAAIDLAGVAGGGSYQDPVTLGISATEGFSATLSLNGQAAEPVVTGATLSRRGHYLLTITTDSGLVRAVSFTIGTMPEDTEVDEANFFEAPARPRSIFSSSDVVVGHRYLVDGNHYYYMLSGVVYLFDLLTGQDARLFDAGFYYQTAGGVNGEPSTYCSFLGVSDSLVLFVKNTGAEGPGISADDKLFGLFVFDRKTGRTTRVPTPEGSSVVHGWIEGRAVVWLDSHTGTPAIYRWDMETGQTSSLVDFPGLEAWQVPEVMGFDGEWVLYRIGDGGSHATVNNGDGTLTRTPNGESLLAKNVSTGQVRAIVEHDPAQPVRVHGAHLSLGRAAYLTYEATGVNPPQFWEDTCTSSRLSLMHLASGMVRQVSSKPQVFDFQMSGSLLYFTDRVNAPPYSLSGVTLSTEIGRKVCDLFTYRLTEVVTGNTIQYYNLFGDRLVSPHDAPRVIHYASSPSTATLAGQTPAPDAVDVPAGSVVTATYSAPLDPSTLTGEFMALSRVDADGAFVERVPVDITYDPGTNTISLDPAGLVSGSRYQVVLASGFLDGEGNTVLAPALWYFTVADTTGPEFLGSSPQEGCNCMAPAANIVLRFDEAVDNASAAAGIQLLSGETPVGFSSFAGNDGTLTITPAANLDEGQGHTVHILSGLTDTAGNPATPASVAFTTTSAGAGLPQGQVYRSDAMMGGVHQIDLPGLGSAQLSGDSATNLTPSPDGGTVFLNTLFQSLVALDADTGSTVNLANDVPSSQVPVFSPDGQTVYYSHTRSGFFIQDVVTSSFNGDSTRLLREFPEGAVTALALSPDGSALAFSHAVGFGAPTLYVLTLADSQEASLEEATMPVWAKDGQSLFAFARIRATGFQSALVELAPDLSLVRVVREMDMPQAVALSPSGEHLAVFSGDGIFLVALNTGAMHQVLACGQANMQAAVHLSWTADGVNLVFNATGVSGAWDPGIYVLDVGAGKTGTVYSVQGGMPGMPMGFYEPQPAEVLPNPVRPVVTDQSIGGDVSVLIDWSGYSEKAFAGSFRVYRSQEPFASVQGMAPLAQTDETTFTDTTPVQGEAYYYAVTPVTGSGWERQLVSPVGPVVPGDGDTLDDAWEMRWFGSLDADPAADPDEDGLDNRAEQREGTDPGKADTDGDGAPDGPEVALGFSPLAKDVSPLELSAPGPDLVAGGDLALTTRGGSGSYTWTLTGEGQAAASPLGVLTGSSPGPLTVTARDALFTGLASGPVAIHVLAAPFGIQPGSPVALQVDGYVRLTAPEGSGIFSWELSENAPASARASGSACIVEATAPAGSFSLTVTDLLVTGREPALATVTIQPVAGDITGDSRLGLDDAITSLQIPAGLTPPGTVNPNGDVAGDSQLGLKEALYILRGLE